MKDDDLMKVARALAMEIDAQPKDGKEHAIRVLVGGDNAGNISVGGTQVVINPTARRQRTWADLSFDELHARLAEWRAQWWSGQRGYWLNLPCLLLLFIGAGIAWGIFTGRLPILTINQFPMLPFVVLACMFPLLFWMMSIRRVEARHIQDCQAVIGDIQAELRRRRG